MSVIEVETGDSTVEITGGGQPGPPGPQGATGPQGAPGPSGPSGAPGAPGEPGEPGPVTEYGSVATEAELPAVGVPGYLYIIQDTGDAWEWDEDDGWENLGRFRGETGPTGATGATGATGPAGATGPPGAASTVPGPQGPAGAQGAVGPQGADSTVPGPQGPQGATGAAGPQGIPGAEGPQGPTGPAGAEGAQGATGAQGVAGPTGATGPQGDLGPQGATGATGSQGPKGDTGLQGPKGDTGATGSAGSTGATGPGVVAGGAVGTYLRKKTAADYDTEWAVAPGGVGGLLALVEKVTNTAVGVGNMVLIGPTAAVVFDGVTPVEIVFNLAYADIAGSGTGQYSLLMDAANLGYVSVIRYPGFVTARRRLTPAAGSHTFSIRIDSTHAHTAYAGAGGGAAVYSPMTLAVYRG